MLGCTPGTVLTVYKTQGHWGLGEWFQCFWTTNFQSPAPQKSVLRVLQVQDMYRHAFDPWQVQVGRICLFDFIWFSWFSLLFTAIFAEQSHPCAEENPPRTPTWCTPSQLMNCGPSLAMDDSSAKEGTWIPCLGTIPWRLEQLGSWQDARWPYHATCTACTVIPQICGLGAPGKTAG